MNRIGGMGLSQRWTVHQLRRFRALKRSLLIALFAVPAFLLAQIPSQLDFAVYATGTGCKAITMSGNVFVDSSDSSQGSYAQTKQLSKGIVGTRETLT